MESLDKIVQKMEAPIAFASGDAFNRLPQIKNLETVMTSLLRHLMRCSTSSAVMTPCPRKRKGIVFPGQPLCCAS
jgi:hypothetical protein